MYINKSSTSYNWYTVVNKTGKGETIEKPAYISFSFKKGCDPKNLNEYGSYEGDLYFIDKQGNKRKVFPYVNVYNDQKHIEFKILDIEGKQDNSMMGGPRSDTGKSVGIEPDELPFF